MAATGPAQALAANRRAAQKLIEKVGVARARRLLEGSQRDLDKRLREAVKASGTQTFTSEQMRATLAQVKQVLVELAPKMRTTIADGATDVAEHAAQGVADYLTAADEHFRGVGSQPLALDEAAMLDAAGQGARSTVLRRLASSGEPVVGADDAPHHAKAGIIQRYGMNTIADFEGVLQQGVLVRKPWATMRAELIDQSPFLQGKPMFWAERIVRTELMGASNRGAFEAQRESNEQLGDMLKILSATFDNRTCADSYAVHGEIRRPEEAFETWQGLVQHPPARPNDREIVVPHRMSWNLPPFLKWKSDAEIATRWHWEGRKGSPPKRPLMTTVPLTKIGR